MINRVGIIPAVEPAVNKPHDAAGYSALAEMGLEELLYLEETLASAKVLIELEKTVPLYYLFDEADS